jgi:sugar transferase (PEP-CTERM/EpsH1 system associated)
MIAHLSRRHSVVVASLAHSDQEVREGQNLKDHCDEVIVEVLPNHIRWLQAFKALPTPEPSSVAYFWSSQLNQRIRRKVLETRFDAILVHCAFVAQYIEGVEDCFRVLDYGDLDSHKWANYSEWRAFPLSAAYGMEARKLRNYERNIASRFHECTVTTASEKDDFTSLGLSTPCAVVPNGVDIEYFSPQHYDSKGPVIAFLGRMDYFPNIDGVCYFAEEILPLIRKKIPEAEFRIIGSDPSRRIQQLAKVPGNLVTGHVPDVRGYLKDVAVSVVPLRIARGTQNKILESMAMGIPVVVSPEAAKGVQAVPGKQMLVAGDPGAFADRVIEVLTNRTLRQRLAVTARSHVEQTYRWPHSMEVMDDILSAPALSSGHLRK